MLRDVIILIGLLLCTSYTGAQEVSLIGTPSALQLGTRVYYMPYNQIEVYGNNFSTKREWSMGTYASYKTPTFDLTYTHSPGGVSTAPGAVMFSQAYRGDVELKLGWIMNPTITAEWLFMDLHTGKWVEVEMPPLQWGGPPTKGSVLVQQRDTIQRVYGGAGLTYERALAPAVSAKTTLAWRFLNQDGWEASTCISWDPGKTVKGDPHVTIGVVGHESQYSWGSSKNFGFVAEFGLKF